jgi:hypothetical protein
VHTKKHLSFSALQRVLSRHFAQIQDHRQDGKVKYCLHDCLMSALAMMFFQDPSLLAFQRRMQDQMQCSNLKSLFGVQAVPKDTQMRDSLDQVPGTAIDEIFVQFLHRLQRGKQLAPYKVLDKHYLLSLDGSQYFSSETIHCPGCLERKGAKGKVYYSHQIVQSVIVNPYMKQVLPLAPESVTNRDGTEKQDCELNAAKRAIAKIRRAHPKLPIIVTADGLYSNQPFVDALKAQRMSYILVAKPTDHKVLFEWVAELSGLGEEGRLELADAKGRKHRYRWINAVPLNGSKDADQVNFFEYWLQKDGKWTYHNSWVTDMAVSRSNVVDLVKAGRARWKIENETFNTLKNQGYHIEHNFGHGQCHLSMNFFTLNLLAFYLHQIFELCDAPYQRCRAKFTSRKEYWNHLRVAIRLLLFRDFYHLLGFVTEPPEIRPP